MLPEAAFIIFGLIFQNKHILEQFLECHRVRTYSAALEKVAVALPFAIYKPGGVGVVFAVNPDCKGFEMEAVWFLCVTLGFLDLSDHS
jgi:hypothetical protein